MNSPSGGKLKHVMSTLLPNNLSPRAFGTQSSALVMLSWLHNVRKPPKLLTNIWIPLLLLKIVRCSNLYS